MLHRLGRRSEPGGEAAFRPLGTINERGIENSLLDTSDFVTPPSFWLPEHLMRSAWLGHAPFAYWLIDVLKPRSIVELGVHRGFSYLAFCQAVSRLGLECVCAGIDTWQGDEHTGFYGTEVFTDLNQDHRAYESFSRLIRSEFGDALGQFPDGSIDLLHIDGCHHFEAVKRDFEMWRPKLSERAIVLFHDTVVPSYGVSQYWHQIQSTYPNFEFHHSHGLGVLGVGNNLPVKLQHLFATTLVEGASQSIRAAYGRLGDSISEQYEIHRLQQVIASYASSTSWRLTAPLRAIIQRLRNLTQRA